MPDFIHPSFAKGEIAPNLYGRVDTAMYLVGLRTARNCIIHHTGGVSNRPGTLNIGPVKDHTLDTTRLFDFQFNTSDQYILVFGDLYMWVVRNDELVTDAALTITNITAAQPPVVTVADTSTLTDGDTVFIQDVVGMTEVNGRYFKVDVLNATTFELTDQVDEADVDGTGFTAYTSGGEVLKVFELTTPYAHTDLAQLNMVQSADVITITHENYAPRDLSRTDHNVWSLDVISFEPEIDHPDGQTVTANTAASNTVRYQVTAIDAETFEESLPALNNTTETITNVTQANPAVVTITGHPYADFDEIEINGIVGMTELNGRRFQILSLTANTFELIGEDSTNHTAYASGGTGARTFVEITTSGATPDNTISWNAVAGAARYAVYRNNSGSANGQYGLIGETTVISVIDLNVTADLTISPPNARNPFLFAGNYPRASSYYEQRQVYGGTNNKPDTNFFSKTGQRKNMSASSPSQSDDAITATLNARQVNEIRHYYPGNDLLVFTAGAEWRLNSGGNNAFEATTLRQKPQSEYGSGFHRPLAFGSTIMFVEENNALVRSLGYSLQIDGYQSSDMTLLANHLLADEGPDQHILTDWCRSLYPEPRLHIVRSDGQMLTMTFNQEQKVIGWTRWDTQGAFEACASLKKAINGVEDGIYVIVKRLINGQTVRHIERLSTRKFPSLSEAYFVDDGASFDGDPLPITAGSFGSLTLTIPGHTFVAGQVVYLDEVQWLCDTENGRELDTDFLNGEQYTVSAVNGDDVTLSLLIGGAILNNDVESDFANDHSDITFNDDGTIAYVTGFQGGAGMEYQTKSYSLSTAYDFSTAGAATATHEWNSGSNQWTSRMLWDNLGYRATVMEMRASATAGEFHQYHTGSTTVAISNITNANPGVVTTGAVHGLTTGDIVYLESVVGMTEVNRQFYQVNVLTTTTFELQNDVSAADIDTTSFGLYTSGGTVRKINAYDISDLALETTKDITSDIAFDLTFNSQHWRWNDDGTKIFFLDTNSNKAGCSILEYALTTPYDLATMSTTLVQSIAMPADGPAGEQYFDFDFCDAGSTIVYLLHENVYYDKYALSTAYDPSTQGAVRTERFEDELAPVDADDGPRCVTFADGANWMYSAWSRNSAGVEDKLLRQFELDTACEFPAVIDTTGKDYFSGGTLSATTTVVDGLDHLEGQEVCVVADGVLTCDVIVTNGQITSDRAGRIHVGLSYTTDIETLNVTDQSGDASQHEFKNIAEIMVRFYKSLDNIKVGPDEDTLTPMPVNSRGTDGVPVLIGDGDYEDRLINILPQWNCHGRVFIRQENPSPLTILAIAPRFDLEDDQEGSF